MLPHGHVAGRDGYFERLADWLVSTGQAHSGALPPARSYWTNALLPDAA